MKRIINFFKSTIGQVVLLLLFILVVLFIAIIIMTSDTDEKIGGQMLKFLYGVFIVINLGCSLYCYLFSKTELKIKVYLSKTRKKVFSEYMTMKVIIICIVIFIIGYYFLMYNIVTGIRDNTIAFKKAEEIVYLIAIFLFTASIAYYLGLLEKDCGIYIIIGMVAIFALLFFIGCGIYIVSLVIIVFSLVIDCINRRLIMTKEL